jgi:hypothetical protein
MTEIVFDKDGLALVQCGHQVAVVQDPQMIKRMKGMRMPINLIRSGKPATMPIKDDRPFQARAYDWKITAFGAKKAANKREAILRLVEEVIELAQVLRLAEHEINAQVRRVYEKIPGELTQELGGVIHTLAVVCEVNGVDLIKVGEAGLADAYRRIDQIREKEARKVT